jgi:diguanylate cyclase (GGDEF)-like protein/PAS domain S-box-containing protein
MSSGSAAAVVPARQPRSRLVGLWGVQNQMDPRRPPSGVAPAWLSVQRSRVVLGVALALLAAGAALPNRPGAGPGTVAAVAGLVAAMCAAGLLSLELRHRDGVDSLELVEPVLLVAVYALSGARVVLGAALAAALLEGVRRAPPASAAFTIVRWSFAAGVGATALAALRLGTALGARNLLALAAAAVALSLAARVPLWLAERADGPRRRLALRRVTRVALDLGLGLSFVALWRWTPLATPLFLLPLALVHWGGRVYSAVRAEQLRLARMQRATHALSVALDPREAVPEFLTEARRCFEAEAVDLVVVEPERRRLWRSGEPGETVAKVELPEERTLATEVSSLDGPVVVEAGADGELAAILEREGWRNCIAAPVRLGGESTAALAVYEPGSRAGEPGRPGVEAGRPPGQADERQPGPRHARPGRHGPYAHLRRSRRAGAVAVLEILAVEAGAALEKGALLETLMEERTKLAEIVDHASDGIAAFDPDGTVTSWNPGFEGITGYRADEVIGTRGLARLRPRDLTGRRVRLERWASSREPLPTMLEVLDSRGERLWISCSYARVPDDGSPPRRLVLTSRDVTKELEFQRAQQALKERAARFQALVQNSSHMVVVLDAAGGITYASPAFWRMLGNNEQGQAGQRLFELVHPDDLEELRQQLGEHRAGAGQTARFEFRCLGDGGWRQLEALATNLLEDPAVRGVVLNTRDVTERAHAEALLAGQAVVLGLIARDAPLMETLSALARLVESEAEGGRCAILLLDPDGEVLTVAAAPSLVDTGLHEADGMVVGPNAGSSGTAVHRRAAVLVPDVATEPLWAETRQVALARGLRAAWAMPIITAESRQVLGTVSIYFDRTRKPDQSDHRLLVAAAHLADIAIQRNQAQARLAHQAAHDALTGLPNRVFFLDRAGHALDRTKRSHTWVAVLFCDLDRFKFINDSLGHDAGDRLLGELARRLQEVVRPGDTVARFGGDEFTILCESIEDESHALAIAERVGRVAATPFVLGDAEVFVTMSIGIALGTGPRARPAALIENADAAMYRAKARGGNRHEVFDHDMRARAKRRLALQSALHRAVERGEFQVVYQPLVCLATRRPVGAEALVRWRHPERGLVGPQEFIGLAEETGLIVPIGTYVLREACLQAAHWRRITPGGEPMAIKVNLSARQFAHPNLVEVVAGILGETGVDPASVFFEITESVLMEDVESTSAALRELKSLGVSLAVDDFGTGYSSLLYLKRFPVDELKVDRTFVAGLLSNAEDAAIVAAVINLAHTLGVQAVAEGVESASQAARLIELGCDFGQGYHFGRPMPAESLPLHLGLEASA